MKSLKAVIIFLGINLLPGLVLISQAQTSYQLVTKKIEKRFAYADGDEVNIEGQRAEVYVETWEEDEILVQLELSARHQNRKTAESDLEKIKYQTERVGNKVYLRNYLEVSEKESKAESRLKALYIIKVPAVCPVYVKNSFGLASISNLSNMLRINSQFSSIGLENIKGKMDVKTKFGDLEGRQLDGHMIVNARRSNITLSEITGRYDITAQYGILRIFADQNLLDLNIEAEKSEVFLFSPNPRIFSYELEAKHSEVKLPSDMAFKFEDSNVAVQKASFKPEREYFANISLTVSFGEVTVEKETKGLD